MYPQEVIEVAEKIYPAFEEELLLEIMQSKKWLKQNAIQVICEFMLPKFLDDGDFLLTEEDVLDLYRKCLVDLSLSSLKEKGLLDGIENETGEEVFFLTEKGKKERNKLQ